MSQTPHSGQGVETLQVVRLSEQYFADMASSWQELVFDSDSDPLFMGWPWLYTWWETWADSLGLELALFGVFTEEGILVGLAPFYCHHFRLPMGYELRRLHFLGNAWRICPTVRTEYCGLVIRRGWEDRVVEKVMSEVCRLDWQEIVVCDQGVQDLLQWQKAFDRLGQTVSTVPRNIDSGVRVVTDGNFEDWLGQLGRNTRLKAYNRRNYLNQRGELRFRYVSDDATDDFFSTLNRFHERRWGKPCFEPDAVRFHQRLLARLTPDNRALSVLEFNGEPVSMLYDLRVGGSQYNLQTGFLESFDSKVALGTLHLGFAIEQSFMDPQVLYYDLLAGQGKKTFYKRHFQGEHVHFLTVQYARHPVMRSIYRLQSWLPGRLRQSINRFVRL